LEELSKIFSVFRIRPDPKLFGLKDPDPDPPLFHTKLKNMLIRGSGSEIINSGSGTLIFSYLKAGAKPCMYVVIVKDV